jgi:alkanesulfonate monooxygenase SsuD/methylene tetrahydromethanopterin reductase-like flavin-dependent oxidoreductase (luciferase family)
MKFGFSAPTFAGYDERALSSMARDAEDLGWDGFFIWDHMLWDPSGKGLADTTVALTAIALATERIRFGALVTPLPRRRPWKFAREAVSLDRLSSGRLVVGVGLGDEVDLVPLGEAATLQERAELLDEALSIVTGLWSGEPFSFSGTHYHLHEALVRPRPVQEPRPPIWVGFWWPHRAPARRAACWDGIVPLNGEAPDRPLSPDAVRECIDFVRRHRSGDPFEVVVSPFGGDPASYEEAGATWWISGVGHEPLAVAQERLGWGPPR